MKKTNKKEVFFDDLEACKSDIKKVLSKWGCKIAIRIETNGLKIKYVPSVMKDDTAEAKGSTPPTSGPPGTPPAAPNVAIPGGSIIVNP